MPHVLALAGFRRLLAKISAPLRSVQNFHARALESGNALRNVRENEAFAEYRVNI
ncbi:MAG: hypothetical protein UY41_C0040G0009 [Candidatus Moranbacteria bacterium GW2011_GWE1_49_15]|nr:MAG: hypothetical protein UY41_C0040G0009 [Candidatus Moranbacteria bacterium GW2011_GWE1_49_15]